MNIALFVVLLFVGILTVVPFVWMVLSSFKTNAEISALNQTLLPRNLLWKTILPSSQILIFCATSQTVCLLR